jgi:cAMP-dependent protein kinase regulator
MSVKRENESLKQRLRTSKDLAGMATAIKENYKSETKDNESEEESEEDDEGEDDSAMLEAMKAKANRGQRQSVSAEAYGAWNKVTDFQPSVHPKTDDQKVRLRAILCKSFLFSALTAADLNIIVDAMVDAEFAAGSCIITEGADGDNLYVIEEGNPVCKKLIDGEQKVVKTCEPGDVFGELALLYNCPRAASVEAPERCMCWSLDRLTFNTIVREAATKRSLQYDKFLKTVSLFGAMDMFGRSQIVDSLQCETFKQNDYILRQGQPGDRFYIVEEGSLAVHKQFNSGEEPRNVLKYRGGDYFGELALLRNQPRSASVVVVSATAKVVSLSRKSFNNLLGSLIPALNRRAEQYE